MTVAKAIHFSFVFFDPGVDLLRSELTRRRQSPALRSKSGGEKQEQLLLFVGRKGVRGSFDLSQGAHVASIPFPRGEDQTVAPSAPVDPVARLQFERHEQLPRGTGRVGAKLAGAIQRDHVASVAPWRAGCSICPDTEIATSAQQPFT